MIYKIILLTLGFISLIIGFIGIIIPILPTTPFLLLSSFCFVKSSKRANQWFEDTKVYKKHLKSFKEGKGMTLKAKLFILVPVYIMLTTLFMWKDILPMRIAIVVVFIIKTAFFIKMPTSKEELNFENG